MLSRIRIYNMDQLSLPEDGQDFIDIATGPHAERTGFDLLDLEGVGPVPATVSYSEHAMIPGGRFQSANTQVRNIVLRVGISPDYAAGKTGQELRRELYKVAIPGTNVRVRLYNDERYEMRTDGVIETAEPVIFSKDPEVQISIICPSPFFRAPGDTVIEDLPPSTHRFNYDGEVPRGLQIDVKVLTTIYWINVQDTRLPLADDRPRPNIRISARFDPGDNVRIRTGQGSKEVSQRDSNMVFKNRLIGRVSPGEGGWPILNPGENRIRVEGSQSDSLRWDLTLIRSYGGF